MLHRLLSALAALVLIAAIGPARAGTLSYSGYALIDGQNVTLSGSALGDSEAAGAGEIQLLGINGGTGALSTFCIDVADWLTPSGQFSTGSYLIGSFAEQVNALMSHVLPTLASNSNASSALQVAIWEAEYGATLTVSGSRAVTDLAQTYLGYVDSGTWLANSSMQVAVLNGGGNDQSQAYLSPVPEPASIALVGTCLVGLGLRRFRRRAATKLN